jgi:subtilisin family serine protease
MAVLTAFLGSTALMLPAYTASAGEPSQRYVVVLDGSVGDPAATARRDVTAAGGVVTGIYRHALKGYSVTASPTTATTLARAPGVAFIVPDTQFTATAPTTFPPPPSEVPQILTRSVRRIGGDLSSTHSGDGTGSAPVNVAVLDSGSGPHNDLNVAGGVDCTSQKGYADLEGHGTIVAGLIGALDNTIDLAGVAPGARIWSVRVLSKRLSGSLSQILCGLDWVTATRTDADPSNDIAVVNMSLGGKGTDDGNCGRSNHDAYHMAVCAATAAGVTVVVAAGNDSTDVSGISPASYDEVLTATAIVDTDGNPGAIGPADPCAISPGDDVAAFFSNFSTTAADAAHTVAAPGDCVSSLYPGPSVAVDSGTSFAAPHVTGVVALCIASGSCAGLTPAGIVSKIVGDANAYNTAYPDYGYAGDPNHPTAGKNYGPLIRASLY